MVRNQLALLVVQGTNFGGRNAMRVAVQQARTQLFFQLGHQLCGRRLADAEVGRSFAERAQIDNANEQFGGLKAIHSHSRPWGTFGGNIP